MTTAKEPLQDVDMLPPDSDVDMDSDDEKLTQEVCKKDRILSEYFKVRKPGSKKSKLTKGKKLPPLKPLVNKDKPEDRPKPFWMASDASIW